MFVSNRPIESVTSQDLFFPPITFFATVEPDYVNECLTVTSRFFRGEAKTACYVSKTLGCVLVPHFDVRVQSSSKDDFHVENEVLQGDRDPRFDKVVDDHFDASSHSYLNSRALLVFQHGRLIVERYGDGISKNTRLFGWSMTKSIGAALISIRVKQGHLRLTDKLKDLVPEYGSQNDSRGELTLDRVLRMTDGFDFDEAYVPLNSIPHSLFVDETVFNPEAKVRTQQACFHYCSHTSNVLSKILRVSLQTEQAYLRFPYEQLFEPVGMRSAVLETDPSGLYVFSSFSWMTARDWLRFGVLHLHSGEVKPFSDADETLQAQVLPRDWWSYVSTPTKTSRNVYGAQWWLGGRDYDGERNDPLTKECDEVYPTRIAADRSWYERAFRNDTLLASGFEMQYVAISPSTNSVVVRLGQTSQLSTYKMEPFFTEITRLLTESA